MATPDARFPPLAAGWAVVRVTGPVNPACLAGWCTAVRRLLARGRVVVCDLRHLAAADLTAVDAVARLVLAARRSGGELRVLADGTELAQLWRWVGLGELASSGPPGGSHLAGEADAREDTS